MRFLVDERTGPSVARWLRSEGYDAFSIYDETPGVSDDAIMAQAVREERILITNDNDFGEKVYREHKPHCGALFLRLTDERSTQKIKTLHYLLINYAGSLSGRFVVATEKHVRFAPPSLVTPKRKGYPHIDAQHHCCLWLIFSGSAFPRSAFFAHFRLFLLKALFQATDQCVRLSPTRMYACTLQEKVFSAHSDRT